MRHATWILAGGLVLGGTAVTGTASTGGHAEVKVRANGRIALVELGSVLISVDPDGSARRVLSRCPRQSVACRTKELAWSPDGRRLLFFRAENVRSQAHWLYVVGANSLVAKRLVNCGYCGLHLGSRAAWSPDSTRVAFSGANGLSVVDAGSRVTRVLDKCLCSDLSPAWSPDGSKIAFARAGSLYTVNADGSALTMLTSPAGARDPAWSPDGRRIAFDGPDEIRVVDADGSHETLLVDGAAGSGPGVPSWSPDGTRILFFNTPGTPGAFHAEVWAMRADGTEQTRLYRSGCCVGTWSPPTWSPDGTSVAFSADSAGGVLVMNSDGTGLRTLSPRASDVAWQPVH